MSESKKSSLKTGSWLVSAGRDSEPGATLNVPMTPASNYLIGNDMLYSRDDGTPTWEALEEILGGLEDARSIAFASGMAAISAIFEQLPVGTTIALPDDCYQGVSGLLEDGEQKGRWKVRRLAVDDTAAWLRACETDDLIWLESPSNPLLVVADLKTICAAPRKPGNLIVVDNTFATPINQQPLNFGADITVQSATKFIGGHSDLLSGIVSTRNNQLWEALRKIRSLHGATPGILESFLATRGVRTLAIRLGKAQENALSLARWLENHPQVKVVRYPGLESHPTHGVAKNNLEGFGTMLSFDLLGGAEQADTVCANTRLIRHATSLGAVESTMERRAAVPGQTHLPASLLRLSVGIEEIADLIADLEQAINIAYDV